jgi:putative protein-disulfide isomerase
MLADEEYINMAQYEFSVVKHLQVTGFPTLFLQFSESKFHILSRGLMDYESIQERINNSIKESNTII